MRVHYFSPFAVGKDFLKELDYYFGLLPGPNDWACFTDGDTMFVRSDFGNCIIDYINRYPETELFTCYASRCHYSIQVPVIGDLKNPSISFHKSVADELHYNFQPTQEIEIINRRIAGHLMLIRKSTWMKIRADVFLQGRLRQKKILGVDTQISYSMLRAGFHIKLMKGIYLVHYLRFNEGIDNDKHLI